MKVLLAGLLSCMALLASPAAYAVAVPIDNGVTGDGAWQVEVGFGGDSDVGVLDPAGPIGPNDVIFSLQTLVDPGADGGAVPLSSTMITGNPTLTAPGQVSSSGSFAGANGLVNWNSVSRIAPGSQVYQNTVTFSSATPFGPLRGICYLDEDVLGSEDDIMVLLGTPGQADFNVLTVDNTDNFGVAHAAGYLTATNATYVGWAADEYANLINAIANNGASYSIPGVIDTGSLPPITDARYPGRPVYGPNDITNAFAFDISPTATTATIACSLGGLPTGQLPSLTIAKSAAASAAMASDLVYTIRYANTGSAATGVVIRDRLPMGATFVSASNGGTPSGDTVIWNIGDLPANSGERTLTLTVRVNGIAGSVITNADYSISGTGIPMVAGAPVSTTLTAATVVIPPIVPTAGACAVLPLPANVVAQAAALSSDGNFVFFGVPDPTRTDPRCATLGVACDGFKGEVSAYNRALQTTRVLTSNSPQGWDEVSPLSGNRAWLSTDHYRNGISFTYASGRLSSIGYLRQVDGVRIPARGGTIVLADAGTGTLTPLRTPFRTATEASGLSWSGHYIASSYNGNRLVLLEAAYDGAGVLVDGGLNFVDIAMQTSFDFFNRILALGNVPSTVGISFGLFEDSMSGDGNRFAFYIDVALTGPNAGIRVNQLPNNLYRLATLAYVFDFATNRLILVAEPDTSRAKPVGPDGFQRGSSGFFVRELGATGTLVALDRPVPFLNTPGNPEQNGEIYIAQPGIGITQVTSTALPRSGDYFSPGLSFITPNERYVYFHAQQDLVGRNPDQSQELFRYDIQTGQLRQVTTRFDAAADLLASLGLTDLNLQFNQLVGNQTSFDGRFVLMQVAGPSVAVDLGGGARGVIDETATLFDCQ